MDVLQAERAVTTVAGQVHMTVTLSCIVQMTDAVFL